MSCNWKPIVSYEKKKTSIGNFVFGSLFGFCLISGNSLVFFNVSCKIIFHSRTSIAIEIVKMFTINVNGFDKRNSKNLAGVRKSRIIDWRTENENFPFISLWEKSIRQEIRLNARGRKRMERMKDFVCRHLQNFYAFFLSRLLFNVKRCSAFIGWMQWKNSISIGILKTLELISFAHMISIQIRLRLN